MKAVVIGGGISGLIAARRLALGGADVVLVEASPRLGGMIEGAELGRPGHGGVGLDIGAEAFAVRGGGVEALLEELGLGDEVVEPRPLGSRAFGADGAYRLPRGGVVGIPADPEAPGLVEAIGERGIEEVRAERDLDARVGAAEATLAGLVRARFGSTVLDRLVAPVARGVYSLDPDEIDPEVLLPGLRAELAARGSLSAVAASRRARATPGALVKTVRGGMHRVITALAEEIDRLGVDVRRSTPARSLERHGAGWALTAGESRMQADAALITVPPTHQFPWTGAAADLAEPVSTEVVAMLLDDPRLDAYPRGTGLLVAADAPVQAKALTHASAKWPWLDAAAGPGTHVVRLSYGPREPGQPARSREWSDSELRVQALADAGTLLGLRLDGAVAITRREWRIPAPLARLGRTGQVHRIAATARSRPGIAVAGTWIDGTGLALVVPGAERGARELLAAARPGSSITEPSSEPA